jgi:hypothetical protein
VRMFCSQLFSERIILTGPSPSSFIVAHVDSSMNSRGRDFILTTPWTNSLRKLFENGGKRLAAKVYTGKTSCGLRRMVLIRGRAQWDGGGAHCRYCAGRLSSLQDTKCWSFIGRPRYGRLFIFYYFCPKIVSMIIVRFSHCICTACCL